MSCSAEKDIFLNIFRYQLLFTAYLPADEDGKSCLTGEEDKFTYISLET